MARPVHDHDEDYDSSGTPPADHPVDDLVQWLADLATATGFLTRLPAGERAARRRPELAGAMRAFPAAGLVVGIICALVLAAAHTVGLSALASGSLATVAALLVTGAMHEDGLADVADGFGGGRGHEEKLEIMRDSRVGAFGVLALVSAVLIKAALFASLLSGPGGAWAAAGVCIAAAAGSRAAMVGLLYALPPARSDGLAVMAGRPGRGTLLQAAGLAWAIGLVCLWRQAPVFSVAGTAAGCLIGTVTVAALAQRQIGGQTGDVAGATQVVSELLVLLLAATVLGGPG